MLPVSLSAVHAGAQNKEKPPTRAATLLFIHRAFTVMPTAEMEGEKYTRTEREGEK